MEFGSASRSVSAFWINPIAMHHRIAGAWIADGAAARGGADANLAAASTAAVRAVASAMPSIEGCQYACCPTRSPASFHRIVSNTCYRGRMSLLTLGTLIAQNFSHASTLMRSPAQVRKAPRGLCARAPASLTRGRIAQLM